MSGMTPTTWKPAAGRAWIRVRDLLGTQFARDVSATLATRIAGIIVGFVTSVVVARMLGPEGRGIYAAVACVTAIGVQFGNLGLHASNIYFVTRDRSLMAPVVGNSLFASLGIGSIGAGIAFGVFRAWPNLLSVDVAPLILALASVPFGLAYLFGQNLLLALQDVAAYNRAELGSKLVLVMLLVPLIAGRSVSPTSVLAAGLMTSAVMAVWVGCRIAPSLPGWPRPSWDVACQSLSYGIRAYAANLFGFLIIRGDLLMVHHIAGAEQSGQYSVAATVADFLMMGPVVIGSLLFPRLSALDGFSAKWTLVRRVLLAMVPGVLLLNGAVLLLGDALIRWTYGAEFLPAADAVNCLLPGLTFLSLNVILMNLFAASGMPPVTVYSPVAATLLNVILNAFFLPEWGMVGAAVASSICYCLMFALSVIYLKTMREAKL